MTDWTDGRPIFMDLADRIAADILAGLIPEETQVPSTNELAAHYRINPATAGAPDALRAQRRETFTEQFVRPFVEEGRRLGLTIEEIVALVTKER